MIFIWTSNRGPLQYVGLAIFLLQFMPGLLSLVSTSLNFSTTTILSVVAVLATFAMVYGWRTGAFGRLTESATQTVLDVTGALRQRTGISSTGGVALLLGGTVLAFFLLFIFADAHLISSLFHIAAVCLILRAHFGGQVGVDGNLRGAGGGTEAESLEAKMDEIVKIVQKMPVEEFVPEEAVMDKCSITHLKSMLKVRGQQMEERSYLERRDLVDAVKNCRNYCDSCVICCEEYSEGDALRILPRCLHEFHLECIDQWAYTFANRSKRRRQPSCPLCNEALK